VQISLESLLDEAIMDDQTVAIMLVIGATVLTAISTGVAVWLARSIAKTSAEVIRESNAAATSIRESGDRIDVLIAKAGRTEDGGGPTLRKSIRKIP
jgi:hypothetical protein